MVRLLDHPTCGFSVPDPYIPAYQVPSNTFRGSILFCQHFLSHSHASTKFYKQKVIGVTHSMKSLQEYPCEVVMSIPGIINEVDTTHIKTNEAYLSKIIWITECFLGCKAPTSGNKRHSKRILGCHVSSDERGCSTIHLPPMATTARMSSVTLSRGAKLVSAKGL